MKKIHASGYYHRMAASFADCGLAAKNGGDAGRAITMYEHALNFELDALNTFPDETPPEQTLEFYRNAISYAIECGRTRKAKHLIGTALSCHPSPEVIVILESLLTTL